MKHKIGEVIFAAEKVVINENLDSVTISVRNTGDRAIQVCSHYHFFESNSALLFDREKAYGMRLDIPSGTGIRFEPGVEKTVTLVPYEGERKLYGFDGLVNGELDNPEIKKAAMEKAKELYIWHVK